MSVQLPPPSAHARDNNHLFMSYSSQDRPFVERLAQDLRERGHIVWIDFEGIRGGEQWKQSIADGLHPSKMVLLVLSPDAVTSAWVEEEIETARGLGKKILPLLLRPVKDISQPNLAWVVQEIQYHDFTKQRYEHVLTELLKDLPRPESGIPGHCQRLIARLAAAPWGLDHYIQEEARLLPVDASPYEDGIVRAQRENLIRRLWQSERLLVLGEPGVGKTVALERLAWELANANPTIIPITVKLLMYDGQPLLEWGRLDLVQTGEIKLTTLDATRDFLSQPGHACYFLLDGLNEVRPVFREGLLGEITRLALEFPQHRIVVTSRIQDESWHTLRQGGVVRESVVVQTIHPEQAQAYLMAHLGSDEGQTLWEQLDDKMRGLAATPLLLWLIKEAWLEAREKHTSGPIRVPENRGELYANFVRRMLRRDDERKLNQAYRETDRLTALERLAFAMHQNQALTLPREQVVAMVGQAELVEALLVNGLLVGERDLRFSPHQTLQEHFAARAIQGEVSQRIGKKGFGKLVQRMGAGRGVLDYANDGWWAETFIQLAGLTDDPNTLAQSLADYNPWLAWWCVQDGRRVDPATEQAIRAKSMALIESLQVADRRRAAQALARLRTERVAEPLAILSLDADATVARIALTALFSLGEYGQKVFESRFIQLDVPKRVAWGRAIADLDPRPGVGLRADGLPDFDWVGLSSGTFELGGDKDAWNSLEAMTIPLKAFAMARYPVTWGQYQAFIGAPDGYRYPEWWVYSQEAMAWRLQNPQPQNAVWPIPNHPRENVTWYEAVAFCRWVSAKLGYEIRLPTELEWERAARGSEKRLFVYGNDFDPTKANVGDTGIGQTSAVGIFPQGTTPEGICDLSGNVWEWTLTDFRDINNNKIEGDARRVGRGGSWDFDEQLSRAASRAWFLPAFSDYDIGFRVVCVPPSR